MLSLPEKVLFAVAVLVTLVLAVRAIHRISKSIDRGYGRPDWGLAVRRLGDVLFRKTLSLLPTFRTRPLPSFFHGLVAWGFMFYLLVNFGDVLEGYISDFMFLGEGTLGGIYRLTADLLSVGALVGMVVLLLRRFLLRSPAFTFHDGVLLHPKAIEGIRRDSLIVGVFILLHVGFRFLGQSFYVASVGGDAWQPFATAFAGLWASLSQEALLAGRKLSWWIALGLILVFVPYFPYTKHLHLFMAPINYLLRRQRRSMGQLDALDFEDESVEQYGAARLEDLSYGGIMDAYACIMCNRCQDVCPAYETGKVLSPAALEINKRYFLNQEGGRLANGQTSSQTLLEFAITPEAVWACTACGACNQICPVGNEPMRDILSIRQNLVLMENDFPEQLQTAYRGMERAANPWNVPAEQRLAWAEGLNVRTVEENPDADILWWVGCAPATDSRAQKTARSFARILDAADVSYAVLGQREMCTGDAARRSGNDYVFFELASANVETLNDVAPKRIVATCPHCLHTLLNEYPDYGGNFEVVHHTQFIQELLSEGRLSLEDSSGRAEVALHDPCYLGRQNNVIDAPRQALGQVEIELLEMPRTGENSFCCGAGGAQFWKEEEDGTKRVSAERIEEAEATGADTLAVGCPFCMIMLSDASQDGLQVRDIAEIVAERVNTGD